MKLVFKSPFSDIFNVLKMSSFLKNTLKINDWSKLQNCFWNISARKYPSKMVQYSKRTFGCQFSNETDPNHGSFLFLEKLNRFPQISESMDEVYLIWTLTLKGSFWVLNHFWGIFSGRDIWKTTRNFWSIINFQCKFTNIQKSKIKNKLK